MASSTRRESHRDCQIADRGVIASLNWELCATIACSFYLAAPPDSRGRMSTDARSSGGEPSPYVTRDARVDSALAGDRARLDVLIRNFAHGLHSEMALLCQLGRGSDPEVIFAWGTDGAPEAIVSARSRWTRREGFVSRALAQGRPAFEKLDPARDAGLINATPRVPLTHAAAAPLSIPDEPPSGLIAGFASPPEDLFATLSAAESYAELMALCLKHPAMLDGLLEAREDGLTGCLSYDSSVHELTREINRSARGGDALSCCFIDLDHFKRVNDRHGHIHGNRVLAEVAQILRAGVRSCDTIGRYGGDEFIAIFPQTTESEARMLAERLRATIAGAQIAGVDEPITASIGVAEWTPGTTAEQLLLQADNALLAAKARETGIVTDSDASTGGGNLGGRGAERPQGRR